MKLLDSTFLIDLMRGNKETSKIVNTEEVLLTTQINMYEVIKGFHLKSMSDDKIQKALELFDNIKVLPFDDNASIKAAHVSAALMKSGDTISDCDCMIAGIALSRGITTIVTRNAKDFAKIKGVKVESY
jgi:predicted nucleic acid-binding protein